jgi:ribokinase
MLSDHRPIVVVGSINMDLVSKVPRIPGAGETIFGRDFQTHPGGKGANQAVAVARLQYPVKMIGVLGTDPFGLQLREHLTREGVDTSNIADWQGATGTASILVDDAGENTIVVAPGANEHLTVEMIHKNIDVIRTSAAVLTQLEIPIETVLCLAEICHAHSVPLILDPAPAQALPPNLLRCVTWITPNETEARFYAAAAESDSEILQKLFLTGVHGVVLKRGALGSVLAESNHAPIYLEAPKVKAVDTTAAGDAFNGAFAVALMQGLSLKESGRFASAAAAISVTRPGAQPSLADRSEVLAAIDRTTSISN